MDGPVTVENGLTVFYKVKDICTISPSSPTPRYLPCRNENLWS